MGLGYPLGGIQRLESGEETHFKNRVIDGTTTDMRSDHYFMFAYLAWTDETI